MTGSAARAIVRLARRDITRHRARSVLVTLLVLLPVAAMVGGITIFRTTRVSAEREDVARMGQADLMAQGTTRAALAAALPAGSVIEPLTFTEGRVVLPGARPGVSIR